MDKHTLKANALSAMGAILACDLSKLYMNLGAQNQALNSPARQMYIDSEDLLEIEIDVQLKKCYDNLKELYKDG